MTIPTEAKVFRRTHGDLPRTVTQVTEPVPAPGDLGTHDVLIKIHAVSLNFRDVAMLNGRYPAEVEDEGIPCSDCAAEVVAIGSSVGDFAIGDMVAPIFDIEDFTGLEDDNCALGGSTAGVLREYAVYEDKLLVHLPKHLSWEEVSRRPGGAQYRREKHVKLGGTYWCYTGCHPYMRRRNGMDVS